MTTTPLSKPQIRLAALGILLCWQLVCASILYFLFNFSWHIALVDSLISNSLLALGCVLISNMLGYYQPKNDRFFYILFIVLIVAATVVLIGRYSLVWLFKTEQVYIAFLNLADIFRSAIALVSLSWCALANVMWYKLEEQSETQARLLATQNLAKEAELNKLRHQLQPHFLFNSLNSVYALTIVNPTEAGTMITKLASFLRGTLKRDDEVWVNVADEMEYIQLYLDIEKVRFSHRLNIAVEVDAQTLDQRLPGTLLQPIVENAIKFGLYNTAAAITISVKVEMVQNILQITVTNPFDPTLKTTKGTGFGLSAIRRRLYLLFADNTLLQTETENNNLYITTLKIPQKK